MLKMNGKALILLALGAVAIAAAAQDGSLLRRTFKAGTTDEYKITSASKLNMTLPTGDQAVKINVDGKYTVKTNTVDEKGVATVENTFEVVKFDSDSEMMQTPKMPPVTTKGTLDTQNLFTISKDTKKVGSLNELMGGGVSGEALSILLQMPEKAVKAGDTWDVLVKGDIFVYPTDQKLKATLVGEKEVDGVKYWNVTITGSVKIEPNVTEAKKLIPDDQIGQLGQIDFTVKGNEDIKADILVDKTTGRTFSSTVTTGVKATMDASAMGFTVDINSTTDSTVKLNK